MPRRHRDAELDAQERELIEELYPALRRFASTVRPPGGDGNDLVQEALLRALRKGRLTELEYPAAYFRKIIYHLAVDESRSRARHRRALTRMGPSEPQPVSYSWELEELRRVSPKARAVLFLHTIEGRPFAEIASLLGCSQVSARVAASRGRRQLQDLLGREVQDGTA
jgi:RNA polymerase sigma factor (sigma-70 family)